MKIETKKTIKIIQRTEASLQKRHSFFTMDRNERVDEFPQSVINNCIKNIKSTDLRLYPNNFLLYKKISSWLGLKKKKYITYRGRRRSSLEVFFCIC